MVLSILIPVFNEEKTIATVLERVASLDLPNIEKEIIVIDDGSIDKTEELVNNFIKSSSVKIRFIKHKKNIGKGAAIKTGINNSRGKYILIQDADLEYNPVFIPKLLDEIKNNKTEVVYGSRLNRFPHFTKEENHPLFLLHYFGNRLLSIIASILYGQWLTDIETGYKLFSRESIKDIDFKAKSFDFEPEMTVKLIKKGYKIKEVPIKTKPRNYSEGKKLNTIKDGMSALKIILGNRF